MQPSNGQHKILKASLLIALSGILYGFLGFLGTKVLEENMSTSTMLFWRFLISSAWMFIFVVRDRSTEQLLHLNKRLLFFTLVIGAIGYAASSHFYFVASEHVGTGLAMVIFFTYPIMVTLFSWLTKKDSFSFKTLFILISMMGGLFLLKGSSDSSFGLAGILFGIASAAFYALYIIGSKKYSKVPIDSNVLTTLLSIGCTILFFILSLSDNSLSFPASINSWAYLLILGIVATAIPIQLMLEGLKYISSVRASIISVLEPLVTVLVGVFLLEESISLVQTLGACIILGSAILVQFQKGL